MVITITWDSTLVKKRHPEWTDEECDTFLHRIEEQIITSAQNAGDKVIDDTFAGKN